MYQLLRRVFNISTRKTTTCLTDYVCSLFKCSLTRRNKNDMMSSLNCIGYRWPYTLQTRNIVDDVVNYVTFMAKLLRRSQTFCNDVIKWFLFVVNNPLVICLILLLSTHIHPTSIKTIQPFFHIHNHHKTAIISYNTRYFTSAQ